MGDTNSPTDADSRTDTILNRLHDFLGGGRGRGGGDPPDAYKQP